MYIKSPVILFYLTIWDLNPVDPVDFGPPWISKLQLFIGVNSEAMYFHHFVSR